jgi:hypothetical protein
MIGVTRMAKAARMLFKLIDKDRGYKRIKAELRKLSEMEATVGIHEGAGSYEGGPSVAQVAFWNEYGTRIAPARSFIRSTVAEKEKAIEDKKVEGLLGLYEGKKTARQAIASVALFLSESIKNKIKSNVPPPNAPSTLAGKVRTGTLIDSGLLLRSVDYEVKE